ncbi:hypothetical protein [Cellvibrio sp. PSBB023]|uniref:hypothetical protein n=1 Tax=Cellvibrio sp. PSBB023 TaxID=1945512 RepID=UPI00098E8ABB|nr:hypothetical protein [Cellvibrio sp. PSBB023]AQT60657.1 hypothetical protein B0D95_11640 [Cellvibrio sp. PSBB023]
MYGQVEKPKKNKGQSVANAISQNHRGNESTFQFVDNRPEAVAQRKLQEMANNSPKAKQMSQLKVSTDNYSAQQQPIQKKDLTIQKMDESDEKKPGVYIAPKGRKLSPEEEKKALLIDSDISYQLYKFLEKENFNNLTFTNEGTKSDYITVLLNTSIFLDDGKEHPIRMNIHRYNTKEPVLGSIWVSYVKHKKSDLNAQTNPKSYSLLKAWKFQQSKDTQKDTEAHRPELETTDNAIDDSTIEAPNLKETKLFAEEIEVERFFDINVEAEKTTNQIEKILELIKKLYEHAGTIGNKALKLEIERQGEIIESNSQSITKAFQSSNDEKFKTIVIKNAITTFSEQIDDLKYLDSIKDKYYDNISKPHW